MDFTVTCRCGSVNKIQSDPNQCPAFTCGACGQSLVVAVPDVPAVSDVLDVPKVTPNIPKVVPNASLNNAEVNGEPQERVDLPPGAALGVGLSSIFVGVLVTVGVAFAIYLLVVASSADFGIGEYAFKGIGFIIVYSLWAAAQYFTGIQILRMTTLGWISGYVLAIISLAHGIILFMMSYYMGALIGLAAILLTGYGVTTCVFLSLPSVLVPIVGKITQGVETVDTDSEESKNDVEDSSVEDSSEDDSAKDSGDEE